MAEKKGKRKKKHKRRKVIVEEIGVPLGGSFRDDDEGEEREGGFRGRRAFAGRGSQVRGPMRGGKR